MTAKSYSRGWPIVWVYGHWRYADTGDTDDHSRPCRKCGAVFEYGQPDPCLGILPGVVAACCGHGVESQAYIKFSGGKIVRGFAEVCNG